MANRQCQLPKIARLQAINPRDKHAAHSLTGELTGLPHRSLRPERFDLVAEALVLIEFALHALDQFVRGNTYQSSRVGKDLVVTLQRRQAVETSDSFDTTQIRPDRGFADDLDDADVTCSFDVRATAQLHRRTCLENTHDVAIFVAKKRNGAERSSFLLGGLIRTRWRVAEHLGIRDGLDPRGLLWGERGVMTEVETQAIGTDKRTSLLHVRPEHLAQSVVQDMRCGVIPPDGIAPNVVDRGCGPLAGRHDAVYHASGVAPKPRQRERGVENLRTTGIGLDEARVTNLSA